MKILVADDHAMLRTALAEQLRLTFDAVVVEAESYADAVRLLDRNGDTDIALVDLIMPDFNDFRGLETLRRRFPDLRIVVISCCADAASQYHALNRGVHGYVVKTHSLEALCAVVRLVLRGGTFADAELAQAAARLPEPAPPPVREIEALTQREQEILDLLMDGLSNKEIARRVGLSAWTVKVHLRAAFRKLRVANRTQAALVARQMAASKAVGGGRIGALAAGLGSSAT